METFSGRFKLYSYDADLDGFDVDEMFHGSAPFIQVYQWFHTGILEVSYALDVWSPVYGKLISSSIGPANIKARLFPATGLIYTEKCIVDHLC